MHWLKKITQKLKIFHYIKQYKQNSSIYFLQFNTKLTYIEIHNDKHWLKKITRKLRIFHYLNNINKIHLYIFYNLIQD